MDESPDLRLTKVMLLKTIPWLREHQKEDGLWHHEELSRHGRGELNRPPDPRLATYHIASALNEFGLLDRLRPTLWGRGLEAGCADGRRAGSKGEPPNGGARDARTRQGP